MAAPKNKARVIIGKTTIIRRSGFSVKKFFFGGVIATFKDKKKKLPR
jgi:hypothetical protein